MKMKPLPDDVLAFFRAQGSRGGKIGSRRRYAAMTKEERRALAQHAARTRWKKQGK